MSFRIIVFKHTQNTSYLDTSRRMAAYFLNTLPADGIVPWYVPHSRHYTAHPTLTTNFVQGFQRSFESSASCRLFGCYDCGERAPPPFARRALAITAQQDRIRLLYQRSNPGTIPASSSTSLPSSRLSGRRKHSPQSFFKLPLRWPC